MTRTPAWHPSWKKKYRHLPPPEQAHEKLLTTADVAEMGGVKETHLIQHWLRKPNPPHLIPDAYAETRPPKGRGHNEIYFTRKTAQEFIEALRLANEVKKERFVTHRSPKALRKYSAHKA